MTNGSGGAAGASRRVWITWERQRRSRTLSAALGASLSEIYVRSSRTTRYVLGSFRTLSILVRQRPDIAFVQNPSMVPALITVLWGRVSGTPVVVDAHNAGVFPFEGHRSWATRIAHFLFRSADLTLVSNGALAEYVERHGGGAFVLPDPLPVLVAPGPAREERTVPKVTFVCSWAPDEPYAEVIEAARLLGPSVSVCITGNSRGRERREGLTLPGNVELTGFLDDPAYEALLHASDLVIDLTTREDCLVCGAYEAMAAGRPLLVSDSRALRSYFDRGTVYTNNEAADIAEKVRSALTQIPQLTRDMCALRDLRAREWEELRNGLEMRLQELVAQRSGRGSA